MLTVTDHNQPAFVLRPDCESLRTLDRKIQEAMSGVDVKIQDRVEQMRRIIWTSPAGRKITQNPDPTLDGELVNFAFEDIQEKLQQLLNGIEAERKEGPKVSSTI